MKTQNAARRLAQSIAIFSIFILLAWYVPGIGIGARLALSEIPVLSISYSVLAVLIVSNNPFHTIGWWFLLVGFISTFAPPFGPEALIPFISKRVLTLGIWIGELTWIAVFMIPMTLILQFFPNGRLPSRHWWPVTAVSILAMLGMLAYFAFYPSELPRGSGAAVQNPFGISGREGLFSSLETFYTITLGFAILGSLVMVVVRYQKAHGLQRAQMKWLVYAAILSISLLFISGSGNPINNFLLTSLPMVMAIAITVAILRYRLFDIDVIIRRTLQYTVLTGLLVLVYFDSVVLLQSRFENLTREQSPIVIVISTLAIAALFNPLRMRSQNFIDRRFYRQKYDAEQTLAHFAEVARDEVDMDKLSAVQPGVVAESMQPENVSVWLQGPEVRK